MSEPAALRAVLVDVRNINTDKEIRLELRVPAEHADRVFKAFGWPTKVSPVEVGIARLDPLSTVFDKSKPKPPFTEMKRSQQAALRCKEPAFWEFLEDHTNQRFVVDSEEAAARAVRTLCRVDSRSMLDGDDWAANTWNKLEGEYFAWSHGRRA